MKTVYPLALLLALSVSLESLKSKNEVPTDDIPAVYKKIYGATSITSDGKFLTIKSNGLPDHKSVYYEKSDTLYEPFSGTTFNGNTPMINIKHLEENKPKLSFRTADISNPPFFQVFVFSLQI